MQRSQLRAISTGVVAIPDFRISQTVRLECYAFAVWRVAWAQLPSFLRYEYSGGTLCVPIVRKANSPDVLFTVDLLVSKQIAFGCNARRIRWKIRAGYRPNGPVRNRHSPQTVLTSSRRRDYDFASVCRPGKSARGALVKGQPFDPATFRWNNKHVIDAAGEITADNRQLRTVGRKYRIIVALSIGRKRHLAFPPDAGRDNDAVFSPDGSQLAFIRGTLAGVVNDVFVVPTEGGGVKRLTFDKCPTSGLAWTADGREVVVSSARGGQDGLCRVSVADGIIRPVAGANFPAHSPSIAPKGDLLAYQQVNRKENIWRFSLADDRHAKSSAAVLISEKGRKLRPRYSPDGKHIAFESDRLGNAEIWDCDNTGGNCAQLTSLHGTAGTSGWSPDGREIAFEFHPTQHAEIYVMDVPGGVPRLIPTIPGADNLVPSWSRDGQWIYFTSKQGNLPFQLWKVPSHGGSPVQITQSGGLAAAESHDGRFLYYCKYEASGVWRIPRGGGNEEKILDQPGQIWYNWVLGKKVIYFIRDGDSRPASVDYFELATHKVVHITTLDKEPGWGLSLAPDGKSLLYVEPEFSESNIMVVKNFR